MGATFVAINWARLPRSAAAGSNATCVMPFLNMPVRCAGCGGAIGPGQLAQLEVMNHLNLVLVREVRQLHQTTCLCPSSVAEHFVLLESKSRTYGRHCGPDQISSHHPFGYAVVRSYL